LPVIRVIPETAHLHELLEPAEAARVRHLAVEDSDDVPSTSLALLLGGFYLSNDRAAFRAVYGDLADEFDHGRWVETLKAGGNSGELTRTLQLGINLTRLAGVGVKRLVNLFDPVILM